MEIIKGTKNSQKTVIEIANGAFVPEREEGFDFRRIMPKAYGRGKNTAEFHRIIYCDGVPAACAGCLPINLKAGGKNYPASVIGSVSTLPQFRNRGFMTAILNDFLEEIKARGDVFCALTGSAERYKRFGFFKSPTMYGFVLKKGKKGGVEIKKTKNADLNAMYDIYSAEKPVVMRKKEDFLCCLKTSGAEAYTVWKEGKIAGYLSLCARKNYVTEICLADLSDLGGVAAAAPNAGDEVTFLVNPLNTPLVAEMKKLAVRGGIFDYLLINVFDMRAFLELLLNINKTPEVTEIWEIDGTAYKVTGGSKPAAEICQSCGQFKCGKEEFLHGGIGDGENFKGSRLFPVGFGIGEADMF